MVFISYVRVCRLDRTARQWLIEQDSVKAWYRIQPQPIHPVGSRGKLYLYRPSLYNVYARSSTSSKSQPNRGKQRHMGGAYIYEVRMSRQGLTPSPEPSRTQASLANHGT